MASFYDLSALIAVSIMSLAVAPIAVTITKSKLFGWFRHWISGHSGWLGELFSCPYCMTHWVSMGFVAFYNNFVIVTGHYPIDFAVTSFIMVTISQLLGGLIYRAYA